MPFDREGNEISFRKWASLVNDDSYFRVKKDVLKDGVFVVTVWIGLSEDVGLFHTLIIDEEKGLNIEERRNDEKSALSIHDFAASILGQGVCSETLGDIRKDPIDEKIDYYIDCKKLFAKISKSSKKEYWYNQFIGDSFRVYNTKEEVVSVIIDKDRQGFIGQKAKGKRKIYADVLRQDCDLFIIEQN